MARKRSATPTVAAPAAAAPPEPVYSRAQEIRGNLTLWAFVLVFAVYRLWRYLADYPPEATVNLLGFEGLQVSHCSLAVNLVAGWLLLTGIFSAKGAQRVIANAHRPFRLLGGEEAKDFYSAVPTAVLAGGLLLLALVLALFNLAITIKTQSEEYEALIEVQDTDNRLLIFSDPEGKGLRMGSRARLGHERPVKLALRGWASPVVIVRDRYDLLTQDAWRISRRGFSFDLDRLEVREPATLPLDADEQMTRKEEAPDPRSLVGVLRRGLTLVIEAPLRLNRPVFLRVVDREERIHGFEDQQRYFFRPGVKERCFTPVEGDAVWHSFLEEICDQPTALEGWRKRVPTSYLGGGLTPFEGVAKHRLEIISVQSELYAGTTWVASRPDAVRVTAYQRE